MMARRSDLAVQVRTVGPDFVVGFEIGALMTAEEEVEVGMRTPRNAAPAFRLPFHDRDLHEVTPGDRHDRGG